MAYKIETEGDQDNIEIAVTRHWWLDKEEPADSVKVEIQDGVTYLTLKEALWMRDTLAKAIKRLKRFDFDTVYGTKKCTPHQATDCGTCRKPGDISRGTYE